MAQLNPPWSVASQNKLCKSLLSEKVWISRLPNVDYIIKLNPEKISNP